MTAGEHDRRENGRSVGSGDDPAAHAEPTGISLPEALRVGEWTIFPAQGRAEKGRQRAHLAPKLAELLVFLARRPGRVVSKDEMLAGVWSGGFVEDVALSRAVSDLRKVFGDDARHPRYIETIPRRGYRLVAVVSDVATPRSKQPPQRRQRRLWAVAGIAVAAGAALWTASRSPSPGPPEIRSLVVLPLRNLSEEPEQLYFSEGMTDQLTTDLAQLGSFDVVSATSARSYLDDDRLLPEIARELEVDAVIEGTVRRLGDRVLINVQLIDAASDRHLWAESYERDMADVFELQLEVAQAIAAEVAEVLDPTVSDRLIELRPVQPEAYEAYLRGRFFRNRWRPQELRQSTELFLLAITIEPDYALAHAALADAYATLGFLVWAPPSETFPRARAAAEWALALDPELATAHTAMAQVEVLQSWNWQAGFEHARRALQLDPDDSFARLWYANLLLANGQPQKALTEIERSLAADPLSLYKRMQRAVIQTQMGDDARATDELRRILEMDPDFYLARVELCHQLNAQGRFEEVLRTCPHTDDDLGLLAARGYAQGKSGLGDEAQEALTRLEELNADAAAAGLFEEAAAVGLAVVHLGLGERSEALDRLERAVERRLPHALLFGINPYLREVHGEPRFIDLLQRIGIAGSANSSRPVPLDPA